MSGLLIELNTKMPEKNPFSWSVDSNTLLKNDTQKACLSGFLQEQNPLKRWKENSYCRASRIKIMQKVDISVPKDCFPSCANSP